MVRRPQDQLEVPLDGYVIDLVQGERLVEIQTGNFSSLKQKLTDLVKRHPVRLVYPIAREKWLFKLPRADWDGPRRRKSPKRGRLEDVFSELVSVPRLLLEDNFSLEVVMIQEEEVRRYKGKRQWYQNGWVTVERRLVDVVDRRIFEHPADVRQLVPSDVPERFTTLDLAYALNGPRWLGQKMAYCLREMGEIVQVGKRERSFLYALENAE